MTVDDDVVWRDEMVVICGDVLARSRQIFEEVFEEDVCKYRCTVLVVGRLSTHRLVDVGSISGKVWRCTVAILAAAIPAITADVRKYTAPVAKDTSTFVTTIRLDVVNPDHRSCFSSGDGNDDAVIVFFVISRDEETIGVVDISVNIRTVENIDVNRQYFYWIDNGYFQWFVIGNWDVSTTPGERLFDVVAKADVFYIYIDA